MFLIRDSRERMMAKPTADNFHRIPGANRIALSSELAEEIKDRFDVVRENRFQLFLLAAGLRKKHLNKKTGEYAPEFQGWYEKHKMDEVFGQLPNFTKYASAGDVIDYVDRHTSNPCDTSINVHRGCAGAVLQEL